MRRSNRKTILLSNIIILAILILLLSFAFLFFDSNNATARHEERKDINPIQQEKIPVDIPLEEIVGYLNPPNELTLFPCSDCHGEDLPPNPERRELWEPHDEIPGKLINHDEENRWCLDCHDENNRDKLRHVNGKLIDFEEYYKICEPCHQSIFREWKAGVHNRVTGNWNGEKQYWHCTQCHDPHNPPFKSLEPSPPPRRPEEVYIKLK